MITNLTLILIVSVCIVILSGLLHIKQSWRYKKLAHMHNMLTQELVEQRQATDLAADQMADKNHQITSLEQTYANTQLQLTEALSKNKLLMDQARDTEAQLITLKSLVEVADNEDSATRQLSHARETSRKITEAIEPWKHKVMVLESEMELMQLASQQAIPVIHTPDTALKNQLERKEQENLSLRLKCNELLSDCSNLNERVKTAESHVIMMRQRFNQELSKLKKETQQEQRQLEQQIVNLNSQILLQKKREEIFAH